MKQNQTTCPTCLDYRQSLESIHDEVNLLLNHAEQAWREHPECTVYRGRLDVAHIVKRRLDEMLCITPETLPEPDKEIGAFVESRWMDATKSYEKHDGHPYFSGRYDAFNEIRNHLNEPSGGHQEPAQPAPDGFIDLTDVIEPGDIVDRIASKVDRMTKSMNITPQMMAAAI